MQNNPLVSIIIPIYNGSNFMREAIDSALAQTYKNTEVIVINDGSTDNTDEIALSYGDKIRYFKKENGGVSSALNLGIKEMKGEYFSWLSHDDKYDCKKIELQINYLKGIPEKTIAYCDTVQIDKNGKTIRKSKKNKYLKEGINDWNSSLKALIKSGCLGGCAFLIPKIAFEEIGCFDEKLRFAQDLYMWIGILSNKYSILYKRDNLVLSRIHEKQGTQTCNLQFHKDTESVAKLVFEKMQKLSNKEYNYIYYLTIYYAKYNCKNAVEYYLNNGHFSFGEKCVIKTLIIYGKIRPFFRRAFYRLFRKIKTN